MVDEVQSIHLACATFFSGGEWRGWHRSLVGPEGIE